MSENDTPVTVKAKPKAKKGAVKRNKPVKKPRRRDPFDLEEAAEIAMELGEAVLQKSLEGALEGGIEFLKKKRII